MVESSVLFQSKPEKTARNKVSFHRLMISYLEIAVYRLVKTTFVPLLIQRHQLPKVLHHRNKSVQ